MPKEGREKSQESFEPVFSVLEGIDSHPKVDKPIHLRSRLIKIKLRRSSIIGRRSIRVAISKLVLDVVFFSFHPSFATTRPSNLPFIRSLCLRWTGNGNIVEISNPLRASPSIHREFTGEKCSKKVFADRRVFFQSFLFPLSNRPFPSFLSFPLRLKFSHIPAKKLLHSITVIFLKKN